jgi:hypothetical protein
MSNKNFHKNKYLFIHFSLITKKKLIHCGILTKNDIKCLWFIFILGAGGKRGSNSFLRRPEVLETVYSVEEDQDGDAPVDPTSINERPNSDSGDSTAPTAEESPTNSDQEEVFNFKIHFSKPLLLIIILNYRNLIS